MFPTTHSIKKKASTDIEAAKFHYKTNRRYEHPNPLISNLASDNISENPPPTIYENCVETSYYNSCYNSPVMTKSPEFRQWMESPHT